MLIRCYLFNSKSDTTRLFEFLITRQNMKFGFEKKLAHKFPF